MIMNNILILLLGGVLYYSSILNFTLKNYIIFGISYITFLYFAFNLEVESEVLYFIIGITIAWAYTGLSMFINKDEINDD